MTCAPSEDSDQPGYPASLIRVFAVHMKNHWFLNYPLSAQRRFWLDWADAHAILLAFSCGGSNATLLMPSSRCFTKQYEPRHEKTCLREILVIETSGIILTKQRTIQVLIRLRGCVVVRIGIKQVFSWRGSYGMFETTQNRLIHPKGTRKYNKDDFSLEECSWPLRFCLRVKPDSKAIFTKKWHLVTLSNKVWKSKRIV